MRLMTFRTALLILPSALLLACNPFEPTQVETEESGHRPEAAMDMPLSDQAAGSAQVSLVPADSVPTCEGRPRPARRLL